jgi:hypothetical protein
MQGTRHPAACYALLGAAATRTAGVNSQRRSTFLSYRPANACLFLVAKTFNLYHLHGMDFET